MFKVITCKSAARSQSPPHRSRRQNQAHREFFRLPKGGPGEVDPHFGLSRSFYYCLEKRGKVKLHRLITSGREKGIVVIRYADVLNFIESQIAQQEAKAR